MYLLILLCTWNTKEVNIIGKYEDTSHTQAVENNSEQITFRYIRIFYMRIINWFNQNN